MGNTSKKVREGGLILGGLGVLGFLGIVWLMIFGNLSGNLGFTDDTTNIINESLTPSGTGIASILENTNPNFVSWNASLIVNGTIGKTVDNVTLIEGVDYQIFAGNGSIGNITTNIDGFRVTYDVVRKAVGEINSEAVISNLTGGFNTFFGFSNTFFTIAAIVLLIFMLVGLLAIVMTIAEGRKKKGSSTYE